MQPIIEEIQAFTVSGISVRTTNRDEAQPLTAKLPTLWGQFYNQGLAEKTLNKEDDASVYGVYSDYESDASGHYRTTAGVQVSNAVADSDSVEIRGGQYLVFKAKGAMPQIVFDTWLTIWSFFETSKEFRRCFTTDFERYLGPNEVAIHIAVESLRA